MYSFVDPTKSMLQHILRLYFIKEGNALAEMPTLNNLSKKYLISLQEDIGCGL